jgi:predicted transcriptional regulator
MSVKEYKESIKQLVDSTDDETLLRHWKKQLEGDVEHQKEVELTDEEWNEVQEGLADYENGEFMSLEEFINRRK